MDGCNAFERVGAATQGCGRPVVPNTKRCNRHTDVSALIARIAELEMDIDYERLKLRLRLGALETAERKVAVLREALGDLGTACMEANVHHNPIVHPAHDRARGVFASTDGKSTA